MGKIAYALALLIFASCTAWGKKTHDKVVPSFEPAQIVSATDVPYPVNVVAWGTIILRVTVGTSGEVESVSALKSMPALTEVATNSVKAWKFKPATLDGKPVATTVIVAFSFSPPMVAPRT